MGQKAIKTAAPLAVMMALAGCMLPGDPGAVTRAAPAAAVAAPADGAPTSALIAELGARRSILPEGSAYAEVAQAVLAANSRAAEAELRGARLRAKAAEKNWLPSLGPQISLSGLSDIVTSLMVEQVLFGNGRRKAERAHAAADVEVAAVVLAQDTNARVFTALSLFAEAKKAREMALISAQAETQMRRFAWIAEERFKGGVADMSDVTILRQKLAEIGAERLAQAEAATAALAELNAMSVRPLDDLAAAGADVPQVVPGQGALPLAVLQAEAEKTRQIAQARLQRAGLLPAITASATLSSDQSTGPVLRGGGAPFGFGTGDNLRALGAAEEAADRRLVQARETASRRLQRLRAEARAAARQAQEAHQLTIAARKNLDMFQSQYDAGQRQVMDVVGVYETYARQQAHEVDLKYNAVLGQLEIARDLGLLADGGSI